MAKNRYVTDPLMLLLDLLDFRAARLRKSNWLREKINAYYYQRNSFDDHPLIFPQPVEAPELSSLNPLRAIRKDWQDTWKPYKSEFYVWRDAIQPIRGLGNIAKGILGIILIIPLCIVLINEARHCSEAQQQKIKENILRMVKDVLVLSLAQIVRGVVQLVTTIPNWLIRMPMRWHRTPEEGPTLAENLLTHPFRGQLNNCYNILQRAKITPEEAKHLDNTVAELKYKIAKATRRGQVVVHAPEFNNALRNFRTQDPFTVDNTNNNQQLEIMQEKRQRVLRLFGIILGKDSLSASALEAKPSEEMRGPNI